MKKAVIILILASLGSWFLLRSNTDQKEEWDGDETSSTKVASPSKQGQRAQDLSNNPNNAIKSSSQTSSADSEDDASVVSDPKKTSIPIDRSKLRPFKAENKREESLEVMGGALSKIFAESLDPTEIYDQLKREGLNPERIEEKSEYIGNQYIVKSPRGLKGTRYFKAIFESDDKGDYQPVHAFLEFQKGPNAFERAVAFVKAEVNVVSIERETSGYINMKTDKECQHAIVKELTNWEEMKHHPENAYKKEDLGTIQVSIETNPRCD